MSTDGRDDDDTQGTAQSGRAESDRRDRIAEEISESYPGAGPEEHPAELIEGESASPDRDDAGQGRHDRGEARHKLRDKHDPSSVAAAPKTLFALRTHAYGSGDVRQRFATRRRASSCETKSTHNDSAAIVHSNRGMQR